LNALLEPVAPRLTEMRVVLCTTYIEIPKQRSDVLYGYTL
jgi:hypothetical protein